MINDPIADMLIRIKNAYMARRTTVEIPYIRVKENLLALLAKEGSVGATEKIGDRKTLVVKLLYTQYGAAVSDVKRVSKPGLRRYIKASELPTLHVGLGHVILSTPKGLKTHTEARKERVGGEILCRIW